ncbi:MAG: serine/threonine protein kinase [Alphaproteobacteria bacterium]|nr:serine/threonine protein kinase [Alphaproteobacteria bacterium]
MEDLEPGALIDDRYIVEAEIGRGGMAVVYRVRHAQLGTLAALKLLTMPATSVQKRLMHEGRVQAALQHPNIVSVSDVVVHENAPGLVMEYVRGPSLDDFLVKRKPTVEQADELADGILKGVAAAHAHGLIHRDLKPANIMLAITDTGLIPKVTDFGLVKVLQGDMSNSKTRSGVAMGTPSYMAPEQISDAKNVDVRADIFSLGAILYELVSSVRTFDHEDMFQVFSAIMSGEFRPIRELVPEIPDRMVAAIEGALIPDRDQRIPDVLRLLAVWRGEETADGTRLKDTSGASPWNKEFLDEISTLGAGGESTAESLRRSLQGDLPTQSPRKVQEEVKRRENETGETFYPAEGDTGGRRVSDDKTQHTMAPIPGSEATLPASQQRLPPRPEGQEAAAVAPVVAAEPAEPAPPARSSMALAPLAAVGGLLLVGLLAGATVGGAFMMGAFDGPAVPDPVPAVPEPVVPDPEPVAPDPEPVAPAPEPVPEAPKPTAPVPAPVAPVPAPVAPTPVPEPAPVAPVPVAPEPAPVAPEPAPVAPAPEPVAEVKPPFVSVSDGGVTVRFLNAHGTPVVPEKLTAGTWKVVAIYDALATPTDVGELVLKDGDIVQVRCNKANQICKIIRR